MDSLYNGTTANNTDCNGDGAINATDTLAIYSNYGRVHLKNEEIAQAASGSTQLSLHATSPIFYEGDTAIINIELGSSSQLLTHLYGLAFTIDYSNIILHPNSIALDYSNCWLGNNQGTMLTLTKNITANNQVDIALTRLDHFSRNGYGPIAQLKVALGQLPAGTTTGVVRFSVSAIKAIDSAGNAIALAGGADSLQVSTGINVVPSPAIIVAPNPTTGLLKINKVMDQILVSTLDGKQVATFSQTDIISLKGLANGVYLIQLLNQKGVVVHQQKIIKE